MRPPGSYHSVLRSPGRSAVTPPELVAPSRTGTAGGRRSGQALASSKVLSVRIVGSRGLYCQLRRKGTPCCGNVPRTNRAAIHGSKYVNGGQWSRRGGYLTRFSPGVPKG